MPASFSLQVLEDGPRNAQIKVDGVLAGADILLDPLVVLSDFTNNDQNLTFCGFRVDEIEYSVSPNIVVLLDWEATANQSIARLTGSNRIDYEGGLFPNRQALGYSGKILLSTLGGFAGLAQAFTVQMSMIKLYTRGDRISSLS